MSKNHAEKNNVALISAISAIIIAAIAGYATLKNSTGSESSAVKSSHDITIGNDNIISSGTGNINKNDNTK